MVIFELKYMAKETTLKYLFKETDFLERLIAPLEQLYYLDSVVQRTDHIGYDRTVFKENLV